MLMLEKKCQLYRVQFEKLMLDVYGDHRLDRYSMDLDAIMFRLKYMTKHNRDLDQVDKLKEEFTETAIKMRKCFSDFMLEFVCRIITIPAPFKLDDLTDLIAKNVKIEPDYVIFEMCIISPNKDFLQYIDLSIEDDKPYNMFPNEYFRFYTDSYNDGIAKAYPELFESRYQNKVGIGNDNDVFVHNFTFQTSERCSALCSYCYQFNKMETRMTFDIAKTFIDNLLEDKYGYLNRYNSPAIILEFIGGEPLLEIKLTRKIYEYFLDRCYELNHPWFTMHRLSICSNGLQYFNPEVQSFFKDYSSQISFNISIDGNKELHDACRKQPNGEGTYDVDIAALTHYNKHYSKERNSKMTLAPSNVKYLFESVKDFIEKGATVININCVFEEGWNQETARIEYEQLKLLADYLLDNDLEHLYIAIFNERQEDMMPKSSDGSFCFDANSNILTKHGNIFIKDLQVGDIVYDDVGQENVVGKINHYYSENNVTLKATGIFDTHCTSDHKILAKKFLYRGWKGVNHYSEPDFYPVGELKKGDQIGLQVLHLSDYEPEFMSEDLAYMIGVFIADGYIPRSHGNATSEVYITPGYDDDGYYKTAIEKAGLICHEFRNTTTMVYRIGRGWNDTNEIFYKICSDCGHLANNKHFPSITFKLSKKLIKAMIQGYVDTDGYKDKTSGIIKVNSTSIKLMNDLLILLRSIGESPTCYHYKRAGQMMIENRLVNVMDRYEVYYNPKNKYPNSMFEVDDQLGVLWSDIREIIPDDNYEVYCPTVYPVDDNINARHNIIVNSLIAKNCGGNGSMLAMRPNGQFYPCIRYMPTSVGSDKGDLCIGDVYNGMEGREQGSKVLELLDSITRRSQTNDICYSCPLSNDCASCLALGQTVFGTPNKRTTFICIQMIAEALSNIYYWNLVSLKHPEWHMKVRKNVVPDEWALLVIDKQELEYLKYLELGAMCTYLDNELAPE